MAAYTLLVALFSGEVVLLFLPVWKQAVVSFSSRYLIDRRQHQLAIPLAPSPVSPTAPPP